MQGRLQELEIRRPGAGTARPALRRDSRSHHWNGAMMRRRRRWSAHADPPFEFDPDLSRRFRRSDE